jgi:hypothetical protein
MLVPGLNLAVMLNSWVRSPDLLIRWSEIRNLLGTLQRVTIIAGNFVNTRKALSVAEIVLQETRGKPWGVR